MGPILTFDCYGTLLDTRPLYEEVKKIARNHGVDPVQTARLFSSYEDRLMYGQAYIPYGRLLQEVLQYCDMELNCNVFSREYERLLQIHEDFMPFDDVIPALAHLKQQGYQLAIMSNTTDELMKIHVQKLDSLIDDCLTAEQAHCYKPQLDFFRHAEEKFHLKERDHYHIAKGYWWDMVPATAMGWNKVWVNRSGLVRGREQEHPYEMVHSLDELKLPDPV